MTDADINQLRDLLRAATPGPWKNHTHEEDEDSDWATISATPVVARSGYKWTLTVGVCDGGDSVENAKNAALIVSAVNALPGLLDEVERLRCDGFDSRHPAAQNLLGRNARLSIALDIVRDILADDYEPTPITAEHWAPIHDQVQSVVRERDELREEAERLRADLKETTERASQWVDIAGAHGAEVDVLRKIVGRLRADAARLDHIEKHARYDPKMDGNHAWWPTTFENVLRGPTLRAAIDAAMGGEARE